MGRVKLELPDKFLFTTEMHLRISDINYGGHMGNDAVLSIIHESRLRFLKKYGFTEFDIDGVGIIMSDSVIIYKNEGFYGDLITIDITIADFTKIGCDLYYKISLKNEEKELVRAKTGIVFFDYKKNKISKIPEKLKSIFCVK